MPAPTRWRTSAAGGWPASTPAGGPARGIVLLRTTIPAVSVVIDVHTLAQLDAGSLWGQVLSPTATGTVQLTPRTVRRLLADEDPTLRAVFTDDHEILGATAPTRQVPDPLKAALAVRDGHARGPGTAGPLARADRHHVLARNDGGPTLLGNLLSTTRGFHPNLEHDGDWTVQLAPDGTAVYTHHTSGWTTTTLPRSRRELHPPSSEDEPPGRSGRSPPDR